MLRSFHTKLSPIIRPEINVLITNTCKKHEQRPIRQEALYNQFTDTIKFTGDGNLVDVSKLHEKSAYTGSPKSVLSSLYYHALDITKYTPRNMFSVPLERSFGSFSVEDREISANNKRDLYNELKENYKSSINNLDDPYQRFITRPHGINRTYLKKENDYDFVRVEYVNKDIDENNIVFHDNGYALPHEEEEKRRSQIKTVHLVEEKRPEKCLDSLDMEEILKISAPFGYHINKLDGIVIKNKFDGTNLYDMKGYDEVYGPGAFVKSLIGSIDLFLDGNGDVSIRNEETVDYIKKVALSVTGTGNEKLANKLTTDFINNTAHTNNDTAIQMGKLMDLYNIEGHELLYVMYKTNGPISLVTLADHLLRKVDADKFSLEDAKNLVSREHNSVDYLYGIPIKNSFRRNKGEEQYINIRKYNTRGGKFYECILFLMKYKLSNTLPVDANTILAERNPIDVDHTSIF
ncbi:MAG: hypothetical protein Terrestrivirus5_142 [Terrestrivirus sp.]|uniref:Uncharacterized protein n=1 Tax=Terrestrivirus sp. TaxID=2487775 RepID=A0A3G4ZN59_9VIRU|nr:MAG: hypothetical protein Terrestrivirus5_142 [Terrestrivirus sp.]